MVYYFLNIITFTMQFEKKKIYFFLNLKRRPMVMSIGVGYPLEAKLILISCFSGFNQILIQNLLSN